MNVPQVTMVARVVVRTLWEATIVHALKGNRVPVISTVIIVSIP